MTPLYSKRQKIFQNQLTIQKFMLKYSGILQRDTKKKQQKTALSERGQWKPSAGYAAGHFRAA